MVCACVRYNDCNDLGMQSKARQGKASERNTKMLCARHVICKADFVQRSVALGLVCVLTCCLICLICFISVILDRVSLLQHCSRSFA